MPAKPLLRVGLTGGIGSGKSTVARLLAMLGAGIYLADDRAKALMAGDPAFRESISRLFGPAAYQTDGSLNRTWIAAQIFGDPAKLEALNALVHPAVAQDFDRWAAVQAASMPPPAYVVEEAAVLIESGAWRGMDRIVVVTAPLEIRIGRVMQRDGVSRDAALGRIRAQMDETERLGYTDSVVVADEQQLLIPQVLRLHSALCAAAERI